MRLDAESGPLFRSVPDVVVGVFCYLGRTWTSASSYLPQIRQKDPKQFWTDVRLDAGSGPLCRSVPNVVVDVAQFRPSVVLLSGVAIICSLAFKITCQ